MPQILELKEINGDLWARLGVPGDFPSGVSMLTPDELEWEKKDAIKGYIYEQSLNGKSG